MRSNVFKYVDYIPSLKPEDKIWYQWFVQAYYMRDRRAMDKINMPVAMRRELYRNHRAIKNDPFNKNLVDSWRVEDESFKE